MKSFNIIIMIAAAIILAGCGNAPQNESTISEIERLGMGIELEFEGTHGEGVIPKTS